MKAKLILYGGLFGLFFLLSSGVYWIGASILWMISGYMVTRCVFFSLSFITTLLILLTLVFLSLRQKKPY